MILGKTRFEKTLWCMSGQILTRLLHVGPYPTPNQRAPWIASVNRTFLRDLSLTCTPCVKIWIVKIWREQVNTSFHLSIKSFSRSNFDLIWYVCVKKRLKTFKRGYRTSNLSPIRQDKRYGYDSKFFDIFSDRLIESFPKDPLQKVPGPRPEVDLPKFRLN